MIFRDISRRPATRRAAPKPRSRRCSSATPQRAQVGILYDTRSRSMRCQADWLCESRRRYDWTSRQISSTSGSALRRKMLCAFASCSPSHLAYSPLKSAERYSWLNVRSTKRRRSSSPRHPDCGSQRGKQIWQDVHRRQPTAWVALDDDDVDWPMERRDCLAHTHPVLGISAPKVLAVLQEKLEGPSPVSIP